MIDRAVANSPNIIKCIIACDNYSFVLHYSSKVLRYCRMVEHTTCDHLYS